MSQRRQEWLALTILLAGGGGVFCLGVTWGLPSKSTDGYLFGDRPAWSGKEIQALAGERPVSATRAADVDADPLAPGDRIVWVNETDAQRAEIIRRYRLFTHHPDEMVTMMSLARMRPGQGDFDPRMYQYGGLWVYPVGGLLHLASAAGAIALTSDLTYYLDHPEAFGRFYLVARAYVIAWALVGIWAVFRIAHRLTRGSLGASITAAAWFALMPVVVNAAHEAKPHLPGVVLTLLAILAGMRCLDKDERRWWVRSCLLCGAAVGMTLSAWPALAVPIVLALVTARSRADRFAKAQAGIVISLLVYVVTNPYVPVNLLNNRELIVSNLANTRAMFHVGPPAGAILNGLRLVGEGASVILALAGLAGIVALVVRGRQATKASPSGRARFVAHWLLAAPALLGLIQFLVFAHGQGGEYARFAMLTDVTLCLAAAVAIDVFSRHRLRRALCQAALVLATAVAGGLYARSFVRDSLPANARVRQADRLAVLRREGARTLAVDRVPAPYCLPPVNLFEWRICVLPRDRVDLLAGSGADAFVRVVDSPDDAGPLPPEYTWQPPSRASRLGCTPMSWADKPFAWAVRKAEIHRPVEAPSDAR